MYLVFPKSLFSIADLFTVCYLWVVCNEDKCCVVTQRAANIFASLGLFAWLVYVRTYCVPIATLNQNKRTRLLYLGDAQIIRQIIRFWIVLERTKVKPKLNLRLKLWKGLGSPVIDETVKKDTLLVYVINFFGILADRCSSQLAKNLVSDSPGLVDFAIGLVNSVLNLPDGQVK